jgi:hypothetical protein
MITSGAYEIRDAVAQHLSDKMSEIVKDAGERIVRAMLFVGEAQLTEPIRGHIEVRRRIPAARSEGQQRTLTPRFRSSASADEISLELSDLFEILRRDANGVEGLRESPVS